MWARATLKKTIEQYVTSQGRDNADQQTTHEHHNTDQQTTHEHHNTDQQTTHEHHNNDQQTTHEHHNIDQQQQHHQNTDPQDSRMKVTDEDMEGLEVISWSVAERKSGWYPGWIFLSHFSNIRGTSKRKNKQMPCSVRKMSNRVLRSHVDVVRRPITLNSGDHPFTLRTDNAALQALLSMKSPRPRPGPSTSDFQRSVTPTTSSNSGGDTSLTDTSAAELTRMDLSNVSTAQCDPPFFHQRDWDTHLPGVQFAYNTSKHATTGFSSFFLLHGREARHRSNKISQQKELTHQLREDVKETLNSISNILEAKVKLGGYFIPDYNRQAMLEAMEAIPSDLRERHNARLINRLIVRANAGQDKKPATLYEAREANYVLKLSAVTSPTSPVVSGQVVQEWYVSTSYLFAMNRTDTFDAKRRKLTHSFVSRLLSSDNKIIHLLVHSDAFRHKYVNEMEQAMKKILDDAAGRVLLVDEIYQLGSGGNNAKKALEAIMNRAYEPRENTPIIILAGYQDHIEKEVFSLNPGFRSRFHHIVTFAQMEVEVSFSTGRNTATEDTAVICPFEGCGLPELKEAIMHLPREYLAHNNARVAGQITQNIKVESPAFTPGFRPSLRTGLAIPTGNIDQIENIRTLIERVDLELEESWASVFKFGGEQQASSNLADLWNIIVSTLVRLYKERADSLIQHTKSGHYLSLEQRTKLSEDMKTFEKMGNVETDRPLKLTVDTDNTFTKQMKAAIRDDVSTVYLLIDHSWKKEPEEEATLDVHESGMSLDASPPAKQPKFARKYFIVPGTSVPSERVFSTAGDIVSAERARLDPDSAPRLRALFVTHAMAAPQFRLPPSFDGTADFQLWVQQFDVWADAQQLDTKDTCLWQRRRLRGREGCAEPVRPGGANFWPCLMSDEETDADDCDKWLQETGEDPGQMQGGGGEKPKSRKGTKRVLSDLPSCAATPSKVNRAYVKSRREEETAGGSQMESDEIGDGDQGSNERDNETGRELVKVIHLFCLALHANLVNAIHSTIKLPSPCRNILHKIWKKVEACKEGELNNLLKMPVSQVYNLKAKVDPTSDELKNIVRDAYPSGLDQDWGMENQGNRPTANVGMEDLFQDKP
ncbi:hypothetical protein Bbelb_350350 [Branchiostoma belcheri]|nr:hypothetical protein Bbelb_350350 [Branchiostoma belcheri]